MLRRLLRTLNPEELKKASGDIFGRIYEYFLTQFADQKAHDDGELFTPVSLVSLISNAGAGPRSGVLEPERGIVLDPACGSGGMFVQSAHFVERMQASPSECLTFYGLEKNPTTIRLAKMNLAVHGLEGDIRKAITYYEDPHELLGKADYVMTNPPFKKTMQPFLDTLSDDAAHAEVLQQLEEGRKTFKQDVDAFGTATEAEAAQWERQARDSAALNKAAGRLAPLAETSRDLVKQADLLYKLACRLIDVCEGELTARESGLWVSREITRARKAADEARQVP